MATRYFSAYASMAATVMLFRSIANDAIPQPVRSFFLSTIGPYLSRLLRRLFPSPDEPERTTLVVDEKAGLLPNQIYESAEIYLQTKLRPDSDRLRVHKTAKQKTITLGLVQNLPVQDRFAGFDLTWQFVHVEPDRSSENYRQEKEKRYFELSFDKSNKETVVNDYLPLVLLRAKEIKSKDRAVRLYSTRQYRGGSEDECGAGRSGMWGYVNLDHPATFETLAMDPDLKRAVIEDLDRFVRRKDYYRRVGKAWKRGYLLYGPPGTGKSSLVAAMANYLKFDVYDIELTGVYNTDLRTMLLNTDNRSIVVIEDIDCSRQMHNRNGPGHAAVQGSQEHLTLSGLLNFIDGLWSTCGDERIIIFTTNHKEKIDPALLRPGRMDMHINMSYCTPHGFDTLAKNYLGVDEDHPMFGEIKDLIREIEITPAEVAEHLMRNEDADMALEGVVDLLKKKRDEKINGRTEDNNKANDDGTDHEKNKTGYGHDDIANGYGPGYGYGYGSGYGPGYGSGYGPEYGSEYGYSDDYE